MKIKDINDFKEGNHIFSFHIGSGSLIARFWMIKREINGGNLARIPFSSLLVVNQS